jgi:predicted Zn-dependent protease with MMP-like domain
MIHAPRRGRRAPTHDEMTAIAERALAGIPAPLVEMVRGVAILVEDFPDEETCAELEVESPYDLLGLYVGTPFGEKSSAVTATHVDQIMLYRRPILEYWCESGESLEHIVAHVLIHEIGHHFGFSDEEMEALEEEE